MENRITFRGSIAMFEGIKYYVYAEIEQNWNKKDGVYAGINTLAVIMSTALQTQTDTDMDDHNTIETFSKLLGQTIVDIKYIETKFHYGLSGNWTTVNTDTFVLHSPEWEIKLSNGQKWYLTNPQGDLTIEAAKSKITVNTASIAKTDDKIHTVPNSFGWSSVLGKEIKAIKFYKRVTKIKRLFGFEIGKIYQDNIQIIQFFCSGKTFSITTMDGDIGRNTFYPTGYLSNRIGFFFDKTIADSYSLYEKTSRQIEMRMKMVYQTTQL